MRRLAVVLLTMFLLGSCTSSGPGKPRQPAASDGCQTLAAQIAGASAAPEPSGRINTLTGLRPVARSGDVTAHSPTDPLQTVQVLTGRGATVAARASLLFAFSETGKATFGGCVATDGRVGTTDVEVADPDPASPLAFALYQVLVNGSVSTTDLSVPIAMMKENDRLPYMFGRPTVGALPPLVDAAFNSPDRLALSRNPDARCEPHCLGVGVFVFDVRVRGTGVYGTQTLARVELSVPTAGVTVDLPAAAPHTLRVAVIASGTGQQSNADPMYAFTAQTKT